MLIELVEADCELVLPELVVAAEEDVDEVEEVDKTDDEDEVDEVEEIDETDDVDEVEDVDVGEDADDESEEIDEEVEVSAPADVTDSSTAVFCSSAFPPELPELADVAVVSVSMRTQLPSTHLSFSPHLISINVHVPASVRQMSRVHALSSLQSESETH